MAQHTATTRALWSAIIFMVAILAAVFTMLPAAHAEEPAKTVRVGWYETPFNSK